MRRLGDAENAPSSLHGCVFSGAGAVGKLIGSLAAHVAIGCLVLGARASTGDELEARDRARDLGAAGIVAYEEGRYGEATERLSQAYALYPASTLLLWWGRALARQDRLVEAMERLSQAAREPLPEDASEVAVQTAKAAESERAALEPRVARLSLQFEGAGGGTAAVTLDGQPLSYAADRPILVDPGSHTLSASLPGGGQASQEVTLGEGETSTLVLRFEPSAAAQGAEDDDPAAREPRAERLQDEAGPAAADRRPLNRTRGLYVRAALGVGTETLSPSDDVGYSVKSTPLVIDLALGTVVTPGLAAGAAVWLGLSLSPNVDFDGPAPAPAPGGALAMVQLGPFADYYFRSGWHARVALGLATARWQGSEGSSTVLNLNGFGGILAGGYDVRLRPSQTRHDTRVGGLLALQVARLGGDEGITAPRQADYNVSTLTLAATLTHR